MMTRRSSVQRVFVLGNPDRPGVESAVEDVHSFIGSSCNVVGTALGLDGRAAVEARADLLIVLGGDGTLLAVSRSLGLNQIPLVGVNFGKLGFLAEFSVAELKSNFAILLASENQISKRMILELAVHRDEQVCFESLAVNDCVVQAGHPFRMIDLAIEIDGVHLSTIAGDGVIICTPVGSTAHNLSAGGPILQGGVFAMALTPLCAHSLTLRPLVVEHEARIDIIAQRVNEGTAVMVDGQLGCPLQKGDRVRIRRCASSMLLVRNPRYPKWNGLVTKLHWGQPPSNI